MNEHLEELGIHSPWFNVPGFLGWVPPARLELNFALGAFLPMPVSLHPRPPARRRVALNLPGGAFLRSGLPNPGFSAAVHQYGARWERLSQPLWLSLAAQDAEEMAELSERVDDLGSAVTFSVHLPTELEDAELVEFLRAAQGEHPFWVEVPLDRVNRVTISTIRHSAAVGLVIGAPRGLIYHENVWVSGRLYGPAFFPQVAALVSQLAEDELAVIAGCGVFSQEGGEQLLALGAAGVQLDCALWGEITVP
jgi:dihydroorotate dehydrogenase